MALKGSAVIELTNTKTGETERYEENNIVTNALSELLRPIGYLKGTGAVAESADLCRTYLGGMFLFDKQIPEDVNQLYPPADASCVGYAIHNLVNSTTNVNFGSYNLTESERNTYSRYMKYVFDFATSQANGVINCICLTHIDAARYLSYGCSSRLLDYQATAPIAAGWNNFYIQPARSKYDGYSYGDYAHSFLIDAEEDINYGFGITAANMLKIYKYRAGIRRTCVVCNHSAIRTLVESFQINLLTEIPTAYASWNYEHDDECLYICSAKTTTVAKNGSFMVTKVNVNDWSVTQYVVTNNTGSVLETSSSRFAYVHQGYIYIKYSSSVFKINLEDSSDWVKISGTVNTNSVPQLAINGRVYYEYIYSSSTYGYLYIVNGTLNKVERPDGNALTLNQNMYGYTPFKGDRFHWLFADNGLRYLKNYLGTINNLARPIEKTSDKTMKITYTIQEM